MICIANNEIARWKNAKRTKTLVDEMRSKAYDLAILNVKRRIKSNKGKNLYGLSGLTARGLAEVGVKLSSDAIWKQVKKRGGIFLAESSPREDTAPSPRADTAPVQEIGSNQESEVSLLYGTLGAEEQYPPTRNLGGRPRESTLVYKKKRVDELDAWI